MVVHDCTYTIWRTVDSCCPSTRLYLWYSFPPRQRRRSSHVAVSITTQVLTSPHFGVQNTTWYTPTRRSQGSGGIQVLVACCANPYDLSGGQKGATKVNLQASLSSCASLMILVEQPRNFRMPSGLFRPKCLHSMWHHRAETRQAIVFVNGVKWNLKGYIWCIS